MRYVKPLVTICLVCILTMFISSYCYAETKIYHGVSTYTTKDDTSDEYNAALLDAKRNAIEQAGTFIVSVTKMEKFELKADDVKVMSSAIVKLVPNSVKKEVIDNNNGYKTIRVYADFEINNDSLMKKLMEKQKDLKLTVSKMGNMVSIFSYYTKTREQSTQLDFSLSLAAMFFDNYKKMTHQIGFTAWRGVEGDTPVIISEEYPLTLTFYRDQQPPQSLKITPKAAEMYNIGDSTSVKFSFDSPKYITAWADCKVVISFYEKNGNKIEAIVPHHVLKQWRDIILSPKSMG